MASYTFIPQTGESNVTSTISSAISYNATCLQYQTNSTTVRFSYEFNTCLCIVIVVLGIVCNILGMVIFNSKAMSLSTTAVYLFYLALSDMLYLIMFFLARSLSNLRCLYFTDSNMDLYNSSAFFCKGLQYFVDIFSDFSACLILVVTIERFIACYHAVTYKQRCSVRLSRLITAILFVSLLVINLPNHILFVQYFPDKQACDHSQEYEQVFDMLYLSEISLFRILPTFAIAVLNAFIILKLWRRSKERKLRKDSSKSSISSTVSTERGGSESSFSTNLILVCISTLYIVCYLPNLICYVLSKLTVSGRLHIEHDALIVFRNYSTSFYVLGFAVNFFLYTIAGKVFRKELMKLLFCVQVRNNRGL